MRRHPIGTAFGCLLLAVVAAAAVLIPGVASATEISRRLDSHWTVQTVTYVDCGNGSAAYRTSGHGLQTTSTTFHCLAADPKTGAVIYQQAVLVRAHAAAKPPAHARVWVHREDGSIVGWATA